jgi:glycerol-3-phosphate dehydrogenase
VALNYMAARCCAADADNGQSAAVAMGASCARRLRWIDGRARGAARVVGHATGAWSGAPARKGPRLRPLRGSHLMLPAWRLPLAQAVSLMHPHDGRPVFAYPWEGVTLVGTTDSITKADGTAKARITGPNSIT